MYLKNTALAFGLASVVILLAACGSSTAQDKASQQAQNLAQSNGFYVPKHGMEQSNYNDRQRLADDPATILWCTFFPPTVGQEPITVPIAGKLTSSNKRPVPDVWGDGSERPGPDGMYGGSSEYRYGFDPTRTIYYDFSGMASICTNEPLVWQANSTHVVVSTAATLSSLSHAATAALKAGDAKKAAAILGQAASK